MENERLYIFLRELSELTVKYQIEIRGCGCCGSPYIIDFEGKYDGEYLYFDEKNKQYILENIKEKK